MLFSTRTLLLALATTALGHVTSPRRGRCAQDDPSESNIAEMERMAEDARLHPMVRVNASNATLELDIYFHVISTGPSVAEGNLGNGTLMNQLNVINKDYAPAGIKYTLRNVTRTVNAAWYGVTMGSAAEMAMKKSLRRGTYRDINVYFARLSGGVLGWCTFPEVNPTAHMRTRDGCVVASQSLPGGIKPYNLGRTLTHELGHWHSLYHTFQGGCTATNDRVEDTPAERGPTYGCPKTNPDTCTGARFPGVDPIHNFMDYTDDICMNEFTPGQVTRMFQAFARMRGAARGGYYPQY